jgi:hypothetical protein
LLGTAGGCTMQAGQVQIDGILGLALNNLVFLLYSQGMIRLRSAHIGGVRFQKQSIEI